MSTLKMILGSQIKAGRILLKMTQADLAKLTKTSVDTLKRIEKSEGDYTGSAELFFNIQNTLEKKGIRFENGKGHFGVKLVKK
jgi:transcriptional regulator with XRE-family HTH domain